MAAIKMAYSHSSSLAFVYYVPSLPLNGEWQRQRQRELGGEPRIEPKMYVIQTLKPLC